MISPEVKDVPVVTFPTERIELKMTPAEVAAGLQHLVEMIFFDSSGNLAERREHTLSIIAARPRWHVKGNIHKEEDVEDLRNHLAVWQRPQDSHQFPMGGACGTVDYRGDFHFGMYPEMLIYIHELDEWWECGDLSSEIAKERKGQHLQAPEIGAFSSSMTQVQYEESVCQIQEYIAAGDIYQVNLTHAFSAEIREGTLFSLYQHLRRMTPSPLAAWMQLGEREILSSSPETFLHMRGNMIETRPIKGTRPRYDDVEKDLQSAQELLNSEKESAELVMITDLERNDLGKVCEFGSVHVENMLTLEKLEQVYHLVSHVKGKLRSDIDHLAALKACFPGGSITGAPKKRAMEIIDELENEPRGLYTGAMGYFGFNGESQFNIPIRTIVREDGCISYHVGAGIVADSDASSEYQETLDKAKGIRLAIEIFQNEN
ncbi:MAG: aminodeoxychorismate synthase component I [Akkermansiaceae bacterium]